ncbi:FtsX-like permease family protein [Protaetiibacter intestinalis]|uniref:FtsX-like permease family protein n=1 Tax=Protaetiibacter intestinalis TaxID=2419774 RepID=A0A387B719_9MICO|nr:FtsX-like permease family protein [Protaetiibacter intestinalis]AYF96985.1 FtsX-like permease family protein [Protaetiibacter intestinalis]
MSRLSTPGLLGTHLRSGIGADALIAVLVAITVFAAAAVPSALAALTTAQLRYAASELTAARRDLTATGPLGAQFGETTDPAARLDHLDRSVDGFPAWYGEPLDSALGDGLWVATARPDAASPREPAVSAPPLTLQLALDPGWDSRVRLVAGSPPATWDDADDPLPIAISAGLARQLQLEVGELIDSTEVLEVAAIYEASDPADPYWQHMPLLLEPLTAAPPGASISAATYVAPESARLLAPRLGSATVTTWWPVLTDQLTAAGTPALLASLRETPALGRYVISGTELRFASELPDALDTATARTGFVVALFALLATGPLGVVLAVDGQAAHAVVARRRAALALSAARGASARQLRGAMAVEGLLIGVPAAALGYLATRLAFPGEFSWTGAGFAILFGLAPAVLLAVLSPVRAGAGERADLAVRSRSGARWVAEAAVLGVTALAVFLVFRRGLAASAAQVGVDPLLTAVPLLLAVSGCVLTLRLYPALLLLVHRTARARPGAVPLLGAARAVRTPALGFATGFALLVGMSISVFSVGVASTIQSALDTADPAAGAISPDEPVLAGLRLTLLLGAVAAILLGALAVVLGSVAASGPRNRLLGVARVLGFSRRQLGALVGWELAPLAIVALVVGTAVGAGELLLVVAAFDLRPFLGTTDAVLPVLDPVQVGLVVAVFAAVVLAAGLATASIARRVSPVSSIKMGAE